MHTVHCTLYTLHCTLYTVHSTLFTVHCTLFTIQCTLLRPVPGPAPHSALGARPGEWNFIGGPPGPPPAPQNLCFYTIFQLRSGNKNPKLSAPSRAPKYICTVRGWRWAGGQARPGAPGLGGDMGGKATGRHLGRGPLYLYLYLYLGSISQKHK